MAIPTVATLAGPLVKYSDGVTLFDGWVVLILAYPSGYTSATIANQLIPQIIGDRFRVRIQQGVYDTSARVYYNTSLEPPNTKYAAYFFDNSGAQTGVTALFTVNASPFAITVPSMTVTTATGVTPPLVIPPGSPVTGTTPGLNYDGTNLQLQGAGTQDIILTDTTAGTDLKSIRWRKTSGNSFIEFLNDALSSVTKGLLAWFNGTGNTFIGPSPTDDGVNTLQVGGNTKIFGNLTATGTVTAVTGSTTGNLTVGGTLGVTGNTTLTTLNTTGLATLASASVTGNELVGGTLGVTGVTTLTGLLDTKAGVEFDGATSGSATIKAAAIAGTPNALQLPTTTGTVGQLLITDGGNPQQLSWSDALPPSLPHSLAWNTAGQLIGNAAVTPLTFNTNVEDVGGIHSTSVNPTRFTAPVGGWYTIDCAADFVFAGAASFQLSYLKNSVGPTAPFVGMEIQATAGTNVLQMAFQLRLAANDFIEFTIFQTSGGSISTTATTCYGGITLICK